MPSMRIGAIRCEAGEKRTGYLAAVKRVDGTEIGIPVMIACGTADGPVLLVDGGVRGDEQEGILAVAAFVRRLDPARLRGVVIGVPVVNVASFEAMSAGAAREAETEEVDLQPGGPSGYLAVRIAEVHRRLVGSVADLEIAIHSGGTISYLAETVFVRPGDERSLELARAMGPDWSLVLDAPPPAGSPAAAMAERDKAAVAVQLGGAAATMPGEIARNVETLVRGLENVARHYGMLEGEARYAGSLWRGRQRVVQASASGILEPNPDIPLRRPIRKGDRLLRITDLFGETVEELASPCDGVLFGFRTFPTVTAGDWVLFCAEASREPASAS